jgi:Arginine methyltransferase-interacting protein, contains RING Zn-finger
VVGGDEWSFTPLTTTGVSSGAKNIANLTVTNVKVAATSKPRPRNNSHSQHRRGGDRDTFGQLRSVAKAAAPLSKNPIAQTAGSDTKDTYAQVAGPLFNNPVIQKAGPPRKSNPSSSQTASNSDAGVKPPAGQCKVCSKYGHSIYDCRIFSAYDIDTRKKVTRKCLLCFCCLGHGHMSKWCLKDVQCSFCQGKHHTLFCYRKWGYDHGKGDQGKVRREGRIEDWLFAAYTGEAEKKCSAVPIISVIRQVEQPVYAMIELENKTKGIFMDVNASWT